MKTLKAVASAQSSKFAEALQAARNDLDAIRDVIAEKRAERGRIEQMPNDLASIEQRFDYAIAEEIARDDGPGYPGFNHGGAYQNVLFKDFVAMRAFSIVATMFPDQVKAVLMKDVPRNGLTSQERAARLSVLDSEIRSAEISEEIACREIDGALGGIFPRRDDASPEILLAPDGEIGFGE